MPVTKPLETSAERAHSPRRWVLALVDLRSRRRPFVFWHPLPSQRRAKATRGDRADGRAFGDSSAAQTVYPSSGNYSAGKRTAIHLFSDLRPHQWIPEEVVFRYRSACESRSTTGRHRSSGNRSTVGTAQSNLATAQANLELAQITMTATRDCQRNMPYLSRTLTMRSAPIVLTRRQSMPTKRP